VGCVAPILPTRSSPVVKTRGGVIERHLVVAGLAEAMVKKQKTGGDIRAMFGDGSGSCSTPATPAGSVWLSGEALADYSYMNGDESPAPPPPPPPPPASKKQKTASGDLRDFFGGSGSRSTPAAPAGSAAGNPPPPPPPGSTPTILRPPPPRAPPTKISLSYPGRVEKWGKRWFWATWCVDPLLPDGGRISCSRCTEHQQANRFTCLPPYHRRAYTAADLGSNTLNAETLKKHEERAHKAATDHAALPGQLSASFSVAAIARAAFGGLDNLIRTALFAAQSRHSMRSFERMARTFLPHLTARVTNGPELSALAPSLPERERIMYVHPFTFLHRVATLHSNRRVGGWGCCRGLDAEVILPARNRVSQFPSYTTRAAGKQLVECISEVLSDSLVERMRKSPFLAFQLDESSSVARDEFMIVYVSFIEDHVRHTEFLGLFQVTATTSDALLVALRQALTLKGIPITKFICAGMDGANTMMGCLTGISTQWKDQVRLGSVLFEFFCLPCKTN
jgi:hypothetical protein